MCCSTTPKRRTSRIQTQLQTLIKRSWSIPHRRTLIVYLIRLHTTLASHDHLTPTDTRVHTGAGSVPPVPPPVGSPDVTRGLGDPEVRI